MWTIYDHPKEAPNCFLARKFAGEKPTEDFIASNDVDLIRIVLSSLGFTPLSRSPADDPVIKEVWLG